MVGNINYLNKKINKKRGRGGGTAKRKWYSIKQKKNQTFGKIQNKREGSRKGRKGGSGDELTSFEIIFYEKMRRQKKKSILNSNLGRQTFFPCST